MKVYHIDGNALSAHWKEKEDMYANERRCLGDLGELRAQGKVGTPEWEEAERAVAAAQQRIDDWYNRPPRWIIADISAKPSDALRDAGNKEQGNDGQA